MHNLKSDGKSRLICMSFDGEYQIERPTFNSISEAWEHSNDLGSKWFFYPFHFVVTESGKTVRDTPQLLEHLSGLRVKTLQSIFKTASEKPENQNLDVESFLFAI